MFDRLIVAYLRAREHPGKLRVVRWLGRMLPSERGVVAPVAAGLRLYLHPRDWIEYLLLRGDAYEPATLDFLAANLEPGDAAVLAGTNFGLHVAVAARAVGDEGLVVGVEPQPAALLRCRANLDLNGLLPRVLLLEAVLGDAPGLAAMAWSRQDNPGAASLLDEGPGFRTAQLRLDGLNGLMGGRRFRLLLLDVQGYELKALSGLDFRAAPEIVVVELDPEFLARAGVAAVEVAQLLTANGYAISDVHGNRPVDLTALPERNLVAIRDACRVRWPTARS